MTLNLETSYYPAKTCSSGPTPGAKALTAWFLGRYAARGARNLGIFNCRTIDGSNTLSVHAEGRACDLGVPGAHDWTWELAEALRETSGATGVQMVIHNRKVWSSRQAAAGWRQYNGTNPHTDHLHVELTPWAAGAITASFLDGVLGARLNPVYTEDEIVTKLPTLRRGGPDSGDVKRVQALLNIFDLYEPLAVDGRFGEKTEGTVKLFQAEHRIPNSVKADGTGDGIVGPRTWAHLLDVA